MQSRGYGYFVRFRLAFTLTLFLVFCGFLVFRLCQLQIIDNPMLTQLSHRQFNTIKKSQPSRLSILDRQHEELAVTLPGSSVFVRPRLVKRKTKTAKILTKHLGGTIKKWETKLKSKRPFVWIQRQISRDVALQLKMLELPGVFVESENKRIYHNGELASNVIGFTNIDGKGLSGIELSMNDQLTEHANSVAMVRDGRGTPSYIEKNVSSKSAQSARQNVVLSLDRQLQHAVEEELQQSLLATNARSVMALVMNPTNGEILSMAQKPSFDSNFPTQVVPGLTANYWISSLFEPGSTMKVLLAAELVERGLMTSESIIDCLGGSIAVADRVFDEAESHEKFGKISLQKVIEVSSNVGAVRMAQKLGADGMHQLFNRFGLLAKTGLELPGEVNASVRPLTQWNSVLLATSGFGQGVSFTPLQMARAYAVIANGGQLVNPTFIKESEKSTGTPLVNNTETLLSEHTVSSMKAILQSVVYGVHGTGKSAAIEGIKIAGKTGTAQKYEAGLGYKGGKYLASFIGFLPAEKPELLIAIFIDEPKGQYYASQIAAPVFKKIAERALQILNLIPNVPNLNAQNKSKWVASNDNSNVAPGPWQDQQMIKNNYPILSAKKYEAGMMPDLNGMSVHEAMSFLKGKVASLSVEGSGYVIAQIPSVGNPVNEGETVHLELGRRVVLTPSHDH